MHVCVCVRARVCVRVCVHLTYVHTRTGPPMYSQAHPCTNCVCLCVCPSHLSTYSQRLTHIYTRTGSPIYILAQAHPYATSGGGAVGRSAPTLSAPTNGGGVMAGGVPHAGSVPARQPAPVGIWIFLSPLPSPLYGSPSRACARFVCVLVCVCAHSCTEQRGETSGKLDRIFECTAG